MSAPFTAQYWGTCESCEHAIQPGQEVRFDEQRLVHVACPEEPKPGPICGGCYMEIPAGLSECPDCA